MSESSDPSPEPQPYAHDRDRRQPDELAPRGASMLLSQRTSDVLWVSTEETASVAPSLLLRGRD